MLEKCLVSTVSLILCHYRVLYTKTFFIFLSTVFDIFIQIAAKSSRRKLMQIRFVVYVLAKQRDNVIYFREKRV